MALKRNNASLSASSASSPSSASPMELECSSTSFFQQHQSQHSLPHPRHSPSLPLAIVGLFCLLFLLTLSIGQTEANPSQQNNKVDKSSPSSNVPIPAAAEVNNGGGHKAKTMAPAEEEEEMQTCTVRVQVVKKYTGKCVRLHGGNMACQTDDYLDPVNEDCIFA